MEVNILPQAVVGNVVLLQGGGARVTIPPGNGFTITVNPVEFAAAGALGAGAGEGAANNIAAITAGILQASVDRPLSATEVLHMLRVDNTLMVQDDYAPVPPATGLFLYDMEIANRSDHHHFDTRPRYYKQPAQFGAGFVVIKHRRRVAVHPAHVAHQRVVCRRYLILGDPRVLFHYLEEHVDDAFVEEEEPAIPFDPVVPLLI